MPAFERVGVIAVVDGVEVFVRNAHTVQSETDRMGQAARRSATVTADASAKSAGAVRGLGRDIVAVALGVGALSVTAQAVRAAFGSTIGAAIAFESSFAGIRKTVDATEEEFSQLEGANRRLARSIPASVNEINRVGELAGQFGVRGNENIKTFERTIIDLSNTTVLSSDVAAESFAQIAAAAQLPIPQVANLGSAVVALGNNSKTTEDRIVDFTLRTIGAGKIAGLTAAEVAGIGAAFASVGVEAEAGGTAIQKVLVSMTQAVAQGGSAVRVFARTAGLSAEEFTDLFRRAPAQAFTAFVSGLRKAGDDAFAILEELGLQDQRLIRGFLNVAGAGDLLANSIALSTEAYRENTALTEEAEKRYATLESRLKVLRNNALDLGITIGNELTPAISDAATVAIVLSDGVRVIGPVFRAATTAAVAFAGALVLIKAATAAAGILSAGTGIAALQAQFTGLGAATLVSTGAMGQFRFGLTALGAALATPVGAALALAAAVTALDIGMRAFTGQGIIDTLTGAKEKAEEARREVDELNAALERLALLQGARGVTAGAEAFITGQIDQLRIAREALDEAIDEANRQPSSALSRLRATRAAEGDFRDAAKTAVDAILSAIETVPPADRTTTLRLIDAMIGDDEFLRKQFGDRLSKALFDAIDQAEASLSPAEKLFQDLVRNGLVPADKAWQMVADAAKISAGSIDDASSSAKLAREAFSEMTDAIDSAAEAFETLDPVTEALKLQRLALEDQRRSVQGGTDAAKDLDARIKSLTTAIENQESATAIAQQAVQLYSATLAAAGADEAEVERKANQLAARLEKLPRETLIELKAKIPFDDLNRLLILMDLLRAPVEIPVSFAIGVSGLLSKLGPIAGGPVGKAFSNFFGIDLEAISKTADELGASTRGLADEFRGAGDAASSGKTRVEKIFDAIQDGIIDLSEAVELGLTDQEVVTLELAKVQADAAKEGFRLRIGLQALATRFPGMTGDGIKLAVALQAIQDHLRKTGQTIAQFIHDTAATALDGFRSMLDQLFSTPTRESLELRRRLAELELTRIRRQRAGATDEDLESLDAQIEQVNLLIQQREKEAELLKLKIQLEDQALQTDRDVTAQARLLGIAIRDASSRVREFEGAAFFDTLAHINAANGANILADSARNAAAALNTIGGSTPQGQHGLVGDFGSGTPVILHGREVVVPLDAAPSREVIRAMPLIAGSGGSTQNIFSPSITEVGANMADVRRQFHRWVDEFFQSSRSRSGRAGASVGSGIG